MKRCGRCHEELPVAKFPPGGNGKLFSYCRPCCAAHARERRRKNGDKIRAQENRRRASNLATRLETERRANKKRRAKPGFKEMQNASSAARGEQRHRDRAVVKVCRICRVEFCPTFGRQSHLDTCSPACSREVSRLGKQRKEYTRRARKRGAVFVEFIDWAKVCERDGWRCQICGCDTPRELRGSFEPNAPEVDHIIPLKRGGPHVYENVQCACRRCNVAKSDSLPEGHPLNPQPVQRAFLFPK